MDYIEKIENGSENPFWTMEAMGEHIQMLWGIAAKLGYEIYEEGISPPQRPKGKPGELIYHLRAVDEYLGKLFSVSVQLMPDTYLASDDPNHEPKVPQDAKARYEAYKNRFKGMK